MYNGVYYNGQWSKVFSPDLLVKCLKVRRTHICEIIESSFFISVVGLDISVLISYSKWMYDHFSLAVGGPEKWHIRAFNTRKAKLLILE